MILVDTSVRIDHLRHGEPSLATLLERSDVLVHPFVTGELALGNMRNRDEILQLLNDMPQAQAVAHTEILTFIASKTLHGLGIGLVDAHLLASSQAASGTLLWSRDRRLADIASRLELQFSKELLPGQE